MKKRVSIELTEKMIELINKSRATHENKTTEKISFSGTIQRMIKNWLEACYGKDTFKGPFDSTLRAE